MVFIRADANEVIATGHIMRCTAIAEAFVEEGKDVCFVVADGYGENLVKKLGFPCFVLNSDYANMEGETETLISLLDHDHAELLLVDSYYVTENYFRKLKNSVKTAYIDDWMGIHLPINAIINYDLNANREYYKEYNQDTLFLLGERYTPLRKQFRNQSERIVNAEVTNVLIMTGGSDHFHVVSHICNALIPKIEMFNGCFFNIVCGRYNEDYNKIIEITKQYSLLKVHKSIDDIELFMKRADVCISAGGTTTKELAACGTPTITISVADNQLEGVNSLNRLGLMKYIGDVRDDSFSYKRLIDELFLLCTDEKRRIRESRMLQQTIDGMGAVRIARELLNDKVS